MTRDAVDRAVQKVTRALLPRIDEFAERMPERIRALEPLYHQGHLVTPDEPHVSELHVALECARVLGLG